MPVTRGIVVDWAYSAGYQCERSLAYIHTGVYTAIYSWVWLYNSRVSSPRDRAFESTVERVYLSAATIGAPRVRSLPEARTAA